VCVVLWMTKVINSINWHIVIFQDVAFFVWVCDYVCTNLIKVMVTLCDICATVLGS
jgi:hypothetical protein